MTILEKCIQAQRDRKESLEKGVGFFHFALDCANPRYLFYALLEGTRFGLSSSDNDNDENTIFYKTNASIDKIRQLGQSLSLNFIYVKGKSCEGHLISVDIDNFNTDDSFIYFKKSKLDPVFNKPLLEALANEGIIISNDAGQIDYMRVIEELKNYSNVNWNESVEISPSIAFDYLRWISLRQDSKPLKRLDDSKVEYEKGFALSKCQIFPMKLALEKMDDEGVVYVKGYNDKLNDVFTNYFLKEKLKGNKTILVARKNQDRITALTDKFKKSGYANIIPNHFFGDSEFNLIEETKRIITSEDRKLDGIGYIYKRNWETELMNFVRASKNENSTILKTGEDTLTGVNKFSYYHKLRTSSVPLNVDTYTPNDFKKDKEFINFFESAIYINKGKMSKYPLYSLKRYGSNDLFQAMRSLLNKTWTHLDDLQSKIYDYQCRDWGLGSISCIDDLEGVLRKIKSILEYNGFSQLFFDISKDPKAMPTAMTLANLNERKNQLFEIICEYVSDLSKIDEPLDEYLTLANSKNIFKKRKGKKLLAKTLRDRRDLPDYIVTLNNYESCLKEFKERVKESESTFGLILYDEEGPKKALEALQFLDEYKKLVEEDKRCSVDENEFVANIFASYDFKQDVRDKVKELDILLFEINEDFENLASFFANSFHEKTLSFSILKQELKAKEEISFVEYEQYCEFLTRIKNSSSAMREAFTTFDAVSESLDNFENDYWYSLYKAIATEKERLGLPTSMKAAMALCCYEPYEIDSDGIDVCQYVRSKVIDYWASSIEAEKVKASYRYGGKLYSYKVLEHYKELARLVSPLQISSAKTLSLTDVEYDYVYIENPEEYSDDELYLLLSKGKKALIISKKEDDRFSGYGKMILDEDSLYNDYLRFDNLSSEFVDFMAYGFEENGLELLTKEESKSAMYFSYRDSEGQLHAVIPNCLVGDTENVEVKVILNALLIYIGRQPLTIIPSMTLMINPKQAIRLALDKAKID